MVADQLEAVGARIRAAYHSAAKAQGAREAGREAVVLDLDDQSTFAAALDGVDSVFLLTAEGPDQPQPRSLQQFVVDHCDAFG